MSYHASDLGYFDWLHQIVEPNATNNPMRTHTLLCEQMFKTPYRWTVPNDDNRVEDARVLRVQFMDNYACDDAWMNEPMSVFEVLIGISQRLEFETSNRTVDEWFWHLINNLGLFNYTDETYDDWTAEKVDVALEIFLDREYDHDGYGGIFPLLQSNVDQREIELWYQMSYYLLEGHDA